MSVTAFDNEWNDDTPNPSNNTVVHDECCLGYGEKCPADWQCPSAPTNYNHNLREFLRYLVVTGRVGGEEDGVDYRFSPPCNTEYCICAVASTTGSSLLSLHPAYNSS